MLQTRLSAKPLLWLQEKWSHNNRAFVPTVLEIAAILAWAVFTGRNLLIFSPLLTPSGSEFSNLIQPNFIWADFLRCGTCFLWNGYINGGAPALAELSGAPLHPLVFLPALIWGVVDGSKVTVVASLALAGIAQWLLGHKLGLGCWARMWSAAIAVVAGHTAGKMVDGMFTTTLGHACATLVVAFAVGLLVNRERKALAWLAVSIALTILSGSGYTQVGLVIGLLPALALLSARGENAGRPAWKAYVLAVVLALLLSAVFLLPMGHFLSQVGKGDDPGFVNFPRLEYMPLSLVIHDPGFYQTNILGKDTYSSAHMLYIGWLPVLLASASFGLAPARLRRVVWVFLAGAAWIFVITSVEFIRLLASILPAAVGLRHFPLATGLAVPMILALAAISLDRLIQANVPSLIIPWRGRERISLPVFKVIFLPLSLLAVLPVYQFTQPYLQRWTVTDISSELEHMRTESLQWIRAPEIYDWETGTLLTQANLWIRKPGMFDWTIQAELRGMKVGETWRPWYWKGRPNPEGYMTAELANDYYSGVEPFTATEEPFAALGKHLIFLNPSAEYAFLQETEASPWFPCQASGQGGKIDVQCPEGQGGILTVRENQWSGWQAWVGDKPAQMLPGRWLKVQLPAGEKEIRFRYRPWDAPLGLLITLGGVFLCFMVSFRRTNP